MTLPAPADLGPAADGASGMGWQVDPWQRHQLRFFDGTQWTEHVADGGFASIDTSPVAELPRSRPRPLEEHPHEDGEGPHVLPQVPGPAASLDSELLLLDGRGADRRCLLGADDGVAGWVERPRPGWPRRALRLLVSAPSEAVTQLVVTDAEGGAHLRLSRPARRMAPVVDLDGPDGVRGTVRAEAVRHGLRAEVRAGDEVIGRLEQDGPGRADIHLLDPEGAPVARLGAVWAIPGGRHHLPPGVLLVDRRPPGGGPLDPRRGPLLLGALLAAELLLPPPPPTS
jgi:hypothetical protein